MKYRKSEARTRKKTSLRLFMASMSQMGRVSICKLTKKAPASVFRRVGVIVANDPELPPYGRKPPGGLEPEPGFVKTLHQRIALDLVDKPPDLGRGRHHAYVPDPGQVYPVLLDGLVQVLVDGQYYLCRERLDPQRFSRRRPVNRQYRHDPHLGEAVYAHAGRTRRLEGHHEMGSDAG